MRTCRNAGQVALAAVVIATVLAVTGGHWQVLQSVAWVRMLVGFSRSLPIETAIEYTFDGQHPCEMCKMVARVKESSNQHELQQSGVRCDDNLLCVHFAWPQDKCLSARVSTDESRRRWWRDPPPVPPPRSALAFQD